MWCWGLRDLNNVCILCIRYISTMISFRMGLRHPHNPSTSYKIHGPERSWNVVRGPQRSLYNPNISYGYISYYIILYYIVLCYINSKTQPCTPALSRRCGCSFPWRRLVRMRGLTEITYVLYMIAWGITVFSPFRVMQDKVHPDL